MYTCIYTMYMYMYMYIVHVFAFIQSLVITHKIQNIAWLLKILYLFSYL